MTDAKLAHMALVTLMVALAAKAVASWWRARPCAESATPKARMLTARARLSPARVLGRRRVQQRRRRSRPSLQRTQPALALCLMYSHLGSLVLSLKLLRSLAMGIRANVLAEKQGPQSTRA